MHPPHRYTFQGKLLAAAKACCDAAHGGLVLMHESTFGRVSDTTLSHYYATLGWVGRLVARIPQQSLCPAHTCITPRFIGAGWYNTGEVALGRLRLRWEWQLETLSRLLLGVRASAQCCAGSAPGLPMRPLLRVSTAPIFLPYQPYFIDNYRYNVGKVPTLGGPRVCVALATSLLPPLLRTCYRPCYALATP
jgi:hypothetical protein